MTPLWAVPLGQHTVLILEATNATRAIDGTRALGLRPYSDPVRLRQLEIEIETLIDNALRDARESARTLD
jgi:hypothetical protein